MAVMDDFLDIEQDLAECYCTSTKKLYDVLWKMAVVDDFLDIEQDLAQCYCTSTKKVYDVL